MLRNCFDPQLPYRAVTYLRMSSDAQNKRSPDQQQDEIQRRLTALGYPWTIVKSYRDEGVSGRYLRKRKGYQQMLCDIKSGALSVDVIFVDTLERLGRVEELPQIRKDLYEKYGVLILTADTNFADPNTPQGKALGMVEAMRATEDGRIKAHNVLRGKRDAAKQRHWPGGAAPFGYKLQSVMKDANGRQEVDYCILVRNPETDWIVQLLFQTAMETGWGETRLARFLNENPQIPDKFKPFQSTTVGYWLDHPIYSGELVWAEHCTGIVDDVRVKERNPEQDIVRIPGFCEPIVSREVQEAIWRMRRARGERLRQAHQRKATGKKLIHPPAPGFTVNYMLSGLVRCGHCGRAMTVASCGEYVTRDGERKRYATYTCHGFAERVCPNARRVPEPWLREVVIGTVRQRLFPKPEDASREPDWLGPLLDAVREELRRLNDDHPDQRRALEHELSVLRDKSNGWLVSLGRPDLHPTLRAAIEKEWQDASVRQQEIEAMLADEERQHERLDEVLDPSQVLVRLERLEEILAGSNPTMANLELSFHIDRIDCFGDGRVVLRTCKLGALTGAADLVARSQPAAAQGDLLASDGTLRTNPRRRARLRVDTEGDSRLDLDAAANFAADPNRFAGLDSQWFWDDEFRIPDRPPSWAAANAEAVFRRRQESRLSFKKLASEFGVTHPTVAQPSNTTWPSIPKHRMKSRCVLEVGGIPDSTSRRSRTKLGDCGRRAGQN